MEIGLTTKRYLLFFLFALQVIICVLFYKFEVVNRLTEFSGDRLTRFINWKDLGTDVRQTSNPVLPVEKPFNSTNKSASTKTTWNITSPDLVPDFNHTFLLMIVLTTPDAFKRRHVIRTTWGGTQRQIKMIRTIQHNGSTIHTTIRLAFVLGFSGNNATDERVRHEASKFGDILRVSVRESYRNIVYKMLQAFAWAATVRPWFILKADHDVYINVRKLLPWLLQPSLPAPLYTGYVHANAKVRREHGAPHYVSHDELSANIYPDYCAGPCYVISRSFLSRMVDVFNETRVFEVEDAYVGVIAQRIGVRPYTNDMFKWDRGLNNQLRSWNDNDLSKYICLGDSLDTTVISYLHYKYMQL